MKRITLLSLALGFFLCGKCQEAPCLSDQLHNELLNTPSYRADYQELESMVQSVFPPTGILTVPIVVHIMHHGEDEGVGYNITEAQVLSAVAALNEDFSNFEPLGGVDTEIQFCLASRDPNGNPTNGINRVDATVIENYLEEGIAAGSENFGGANEIAVKSLSIWPRTDYYNIWVVSEIRNSNNCSGIQGYAYFPTSSASVDGTVMDDGAFGTEGTVCNSLSDGSILSHEVGHGLFLYHVFEGGCTEDNCETQGDLICDTAPSWVTYGCTTTSCDGTGEMENYLGYTSCKHIFTQLQKDRMRNTLSTYRSSLLASDGCTPSNLCLGDLNGDLVVDIIDFIQFNSAYGTSCTGCIEDLNGDGQVNSEDFLILNSNYGNLCVGGAVSQPIDYEPINVDFLGRQR